MTVTAKPSAAWNQDCFKWASVDWQMVILIIAIWLVMIILVNPVGNFPLNDDWSFAASARLLADIGHFVFPDWSAANIVAQIFWGSLFIKIFGFSFTVLRFSTLILGLIGIIAVYRLLREIKTSSGLSAIAALLIAVNPIYFASSNTFMTDIPFYSFSVLSLFFLTRFLLYNNTSEIVLGIAAACLAVLVRQLGFAIPIAFVFAYLAGRQLTGKSLTVSLFPLVGCVSSHFALKLWLQLDGQSPTMYGHQINQVKNALSQPILDVVTNFSYNIFVSILYIGLFLFPLLILTFFNNRNIITKKFIYFGLISVAVTWLLLYFGQSRILNWPLLGNPISWNGVGPLLQSGSLGYVPKNIIYLRTFWTIIGFVAIASFGLMLYLLLYFSKFILVHISERKHINVRLAILFSATTIIYLLPVAGVAQLFDRYLLLPITTVMLLFFMIPSFTKLENFSGLGKLTTILSVSFMGLITVPATHDYLSWNRVRWAALDDMVLNKKINPARIDGGFEFNGSYLYNPKQITANPKGWWVVDNEFIIAYENRVLVQNYGYRTVASYPVNSWLSFSPHTIYVVQRTY